MIYVQDSDFTLHLGDALDVLRTMPDGSVDCVVTSPPYWGLRDYSTEGQLGLEPTPDAYVTRMVGVFREVRRVLSPFGTCWVNLGDSYAMGKPKGWAADSMNDLGWEPHASKLRAPDLKPKDLVGIPWRVAFALQADGWYLRSDIVWSKPNPMPESVTDRPTKAHEYVFLLSRGPRYWFDQEAVREPNTELSIRVHGEGRYARSDGTSKPMEGLRGQRKDWDRSDPSPGLRNGRELSGRNIRSVWEIATQPYAEAHFATFPEALVERCLKAGCPEGGTVLDPFMGSGTTALVARRLGRHAIGIELNEQYAAMCAKRTRQLSLLA